jgi:hypothetical protein
LVAKHRESGFFLELNSKNLLDVVSINEKGDRVLIEGKLGELDNRFP